MNSDIEIHGQGTFPNIKVPLKEFVMILKKNLEREEVPLDSIRLNGGAASHVIGMRQMIDDIGYNDLDLIFGLRSDDENVFEVVRLMLYSTLRSLLPAENSTEECSHSNCNGNTNSSPSTANEKAEELEVVAVQPQSRVSSLSDGVIDDGYVQKMVKVITHNDCWSLISLYNNDGENVEVKFVHRMKRQYEFSVDSFQIELDSLLSYYELNHEKSVSFTKEFYPTVMAESKFGKFDEALFHLNNKLVATLKPEEIRGGGLLKYCNLLLNGYNIADSDIKNMERYMCSRFFIDFPDANSQQNKLQNYLRTHLRKAPRAARRKGAQNMKGSSSGNQQSVQQSSGSSQPPAGSSENKENCPGDVTNPVQITLPPPTNPQLQQKEKTVDDGSLEQHRINFLLIARRIIDDSTVCLMNIERACTLNLLDGMIADLLKVCIAKAEGAKHSLDIAESGYYSENSSTVSNPLSSPSSHFSRSSSPGVSMNGGATVSNASRSSSPATAAAAAVYGMAGGAQSITASRLAHFDLAAFCVSPNGAFLHPASAATSLQFGTQQLIHAHPYATNFHHHGFSMITSGCYASSRGGASDHGGAVLMNHQHYHNQQHNQNNSSTERGSRHSVGSRVDGYHHNNSGHHYQYHNNNHHNSYHHPNHHPHHQHHHHQAKGHGGSRNKGSNKDYYYSKANHNSSYSLSNSLNSYQNGHFYSSHGNVNGHYMSTAAPGGHGSIPADAHYSPSSSYICSYDNDGYTDAFPPLGSNRNASGSVGNNGGNYYPNSYYGSSGNLSGSIGSSNANYTSTHPYSYQNYSSQHSSCTRNAANSLRQAGPPQCMPATTGGNSGSSYNDWHDQESLNEELAECRGRDLNNRQGTPTDCETITAQQQQQRRANNFFPASNAAQKSRNCFPADENNEQNDDEFDEDDEDDATSTSETSSTVSRDLMTPHDTVTSATTPMNKSKLLVAC